MQTTLRANPHPGQLTVHRAPERFKVLAAGRRWGKTRLGVHECAHDEVTISSHPFTCLIQGQIVQFSKHKGEIS